MQRPGIESINGSRRWSRSLSFSRTRSRFREVFREVMVVGMSLHRSINELAVGSPVAMWDGVKEENKMRKTLLAAAATFLVFSTAAFAQVEQPSQVSIQGTA